MSRTVTVNVNFVLEVEIEDEDVEVGNVLDEMDYSFSPNTEGSQIVYTELREYEVI